MEVNLNDLKEIVREMAATTEKLANVVQRIALEESLRRLRNEKN